MQLTKAAVTHILNESRAADPSGGPFEACELRLFKNDLLPTFNTLLADVEEADFTGYVGDASVTFTNAVNEGPASAKIIEDGLSSFTCTGDSTINTVYGYFIEWEGELIAARRFSSPIVMNQAGKNISIVAAIVLPSTLVDEDAIMES